MLSTITTLIAALGGLPFESLVLFVALGAMALAAFTIHIVASTFGERRRD